MFDSFHKDDLQIFTRLIIYQNVFFLEKKKKKTLQNTLLNSAFALNDLYLLPFPLKRLEITVDLI
jgi:hypothetical protein